MDWVISFYDEYELAYVPPDVAAPVVVYVNRGQQCFGSAYGKTPEEALERAMHYVDRVLSPVFYPRGEAY